MCVSPAQTVALMQNEMIIIQVVWCEVLTPYKQGGKCLDLLITYWHLISELPGEAM